jgi:hypothetical protein
MAAGQSDGAGYGEDPHGGGPRAGKDPGALAGGGARGEDVVHQDDVTARDRWSPDHAEGPADVPPSRRGVEIGLGGRCREAHEGIADHRNAPGALKTPRNEQGLVVTTLALAAAMQRHRHEKIGPGPGQRGEAEPGQKIAQRIREPAPAAELEGMDSLAHEAPVPRRRTRIRKGWAPLSAHRAEPLDSEREAAAPAPGWQDPIKAPPARSAQRVAPGGAQLLAADGTKGREDEVEGCGDPWPPARRGGGGGR